MAWGAGLGRHASLLRRPFASHLHLRHSTVAPQQTHAVAPRLRCRCVDTQVTALGAAWRLCADYFFVPMRPENMVNGRMTGDASFARLYAYIRETWPYWNRTVDAGTARHFHLLPCVHGPGDCGYGQLLAISFSFATIGEQVQEHVCRHALPARAAGLDAADHLL